MTFIRFLSIKNICRRPVRSFALILLSAFMAMSVFGGSFFVSSLRRGLSGYKERLGADVIVVPYEARTKGTFESVLLQGIPGNFYMDYSLYEKICGIEGVETAAAQFYLASASSSCCSASVQIIGFDPEKDFTIQPWIRDVYDRELTEGDIIVGSGISIPEDRILTFYGVDCRVVARLGDTGTGLDTAVYANMETIGRMVEGAKERGFSYFNNLKPGKTVSSVMIRVAEGYDPAMVAGNINIHVRKVEASQAGTMFAGIAGGLKNVSAVIGLLTAVIWILAIVILAVAFTMIANERTREFAVLRAIGASGRMVSRLLLAESALLSLIGAAAGVSFAALILFPFGRSVSRRLELPFMIPDIWQTAVYALAALMITTVCGAVVSALTAQRISRKDTGLILREVN